MKNQAVLKCDSICINLKKRTN